MRKHQQHFFVSLLILSLFLDAVNIDDLVMPRGMIHEEYEGQSTESQSSVAFSTPSSQAFPAAKAFRNVSKGASVLHSGQWIDEDSPSLAASATLTQDIFGFLILASRPRAIVSYRPTFEFSVICKLQL